MKKLFTACLFFTGLHLIAHQETQDLAQPPTIDIRGIITQHLAQAKQASQEWVSIYATHFTDAEINTLLNFWYTGYSASCSECGLRKQLYDSIINTYQAFSYCHERHYQEIQRTLETEQQLLSSTMQMAAHHEQTIALFKHTEATLKQFGHDDKLLNHALQELQKYNRELIIQFAHAARPISDMLFQAIQKTGTSFINTFAQMHHTYENYAQDRHQLDVPQEQNHIAALESSYRLTRYLQNQCIEYALQSNCFNDQINLFIAFTGEVMKQYYCSVYAYARESRPACCLYQLPLELPTPNEIPAQLPDLCPIASQDA